MNIAVKSTTEQRAGYVFASLTVHLAGMTLGDKNAEDLCGTVTAGLQTVIHNIRGLIRDPHATLRWEQAKKHPPEEYTGTGSFSFPAGNICGTHNRSGTSSQQQVKQLHYPVRTRTRGSQKKYSNHAEDSALKPLTTRVPSWV